MEAHAEQLAHQVYLARLAHQGAAAEADAIRREREFRPERSIFVEIAGQAAARADIRETELQQLQRRLAGLVRSANNLWDPSPKVLAALDGAR